MENVIGDDALTSKCVFKAETKDELVELINGLSDEKVTIVVKSLYYESEFLKEFGSKKVQVILYSRLLFGVDVSDTVGIFYQANYDSNFDLQLKSKFLRIQKKEEVKPWIFLPKISTNCGMSTRSLGFCNSEEEVETAIRKDMDQTGFQRYQYQVEKFR